MKILIACEFSGIVREAFKAKGHFPLDVVTFMCNDGYTIKHRR